MRRVWLAVLVGSAAVLFPTAAVAAKHHAKPKPKPAGIKTGTYTAKVSAGLPQKFSLAVTHAKCPSVLGQSATGVHFCVALSGTPPIAGCTTPVVQEFPLAGFAVPVALSASGTTTEHGSVTEPPAVPGAGPETGQATFSVTVTKKGTATGYFEQDLTYSAGSASGLPCDSGKVSFTAKLG